MRLGRVLDFKDELQMIKSKKTFEEKKANFFPHFIRHLELYQNQFIVEKHFGESWGTNEFII
ncbi:hypothetical protein [uncultured Brevibacillus sp.]|uniref:hypothetical protein n=1 Tax=uncultured Brevibacillus sp. TaxID=169970 RepID=UPI002595910E|nr:hypothetical protein [uncultured Brevibacillus sp.]